MQPLLAITMGDPAGIGAEVIVRSWLEPDVAKTRRFVVGIPSVIARAVKLVGCDLQVRALKAESEEFDSTNEIGVLPIVTSNSPRSEIETVGKVDRRCGEAAFQSLRLAAELAIHKRVAAIVTAPLNKESLRLAGHNVPGHTEMLAEWTGAERHAMMLYLPPDGALAEYANRSNGDNAMSGSNRLPCPAQSDLGESGWTDRPGRRSCDTSHSFARSLSAFDARCDLRHLRTRR